MMIGDKKNDRYFGIQHWTKVLFCHWPVPKGLLKTFIPEPLQLETFRKKAWLTVILFQAKYSRFKYLPKILSYPPFWQMNIRTYVHDKRYGSGVYFLNIHCSNLIATKLGTLVSLPYVFTPMRSKHQGNVLFLENIPQQKEQLNFKLSYFPLNKKINNNLSNWLVERYRFFYLQDNYIMTARVSHEKWSLFQVNGKVNVSGLFSGNLESHLLNPILMSGKNNIAYLHPFEKVAIVNKYT